MTKELITFSCYLATVLVAPNIRYVASKAHVITNRSIQVAIGAVVFLAACYVAATFGIETEFIKFAAYSIFCIVVSFFWAYATSPILAKDLRYYPRCATFFSLCATLMMSAK